MSVEFGSFNELSRCLSSKATSELSSNVVRAVATKFANAKITSDAEATEHLKEAFRRVRYVRNVNNLSNAEQDVVNIVADSLFECSKNQ